MKQVKDKVPFTIQTVLTDNGKYFTDRFTRAGERKPSGNHAFDQECHVYGIEHRLIKPGRPQTNGMVELFNGRISDVLADTSGEGLGQTLKRHCWLYNHHILQKVLHHQSPIAAMKEWQAKQPELFTKRVVNHPGPEKWMCSLAPAAQNSLRNRECGWGSSERSPLCQPGCPVGDFA